jgi:hypothetical protein
VVIPAVTEEQVMAAYKRDYRAYVVPELSDSWLAKATALIAVLGLSASLHPART